MLLRSDVRCKELGMGSVHEFDSFLADGNKWLKVVMERMKTDDPHAAHGALRASLHALRDRMPPENAVHLGAQLPTLIRGIFFENWHMSGTPTKERHLAPFLDHVKAAIPKSMGLDAEDAAHAVFEVISDQIDDREVAKVLRMLPRELRDLWPLLAQIDAAEK
jgi:uncharacterized protein (DUF2267 family)